MNEIRSLFISGPSGRLEALLNTGRADAPYSALVCHPHPLYGGTMHNKVVYHAMKTLNALGLPVLRFNFRGAGLSEGTHDEGHGERDDIGRALDWLKQEYGLPTIFAGFSFGAATGLKRCCPDPRVVGLIALGTPFAVMGRGYKYCFLSDCAKPKLLVSGDQDEYGAADRLAEVFDRAAEPKELVLVKGAGHFFEGKLPLVHQAITDWLLRQFPVLKLEQRA
jgi:alpha/beta superfamily hydrolase